MNTIILDERWYNFPSASGKSMGIRLGNHWTHLHANSPDRAGLTHKKKSRRVQAQSHILVVASGGSAGRHIRLLSRRTIWSCYSTIDNVDRYDKHSFWHDEPQIKTWIYCAGSGSGSGSGSAQIASLKISIMTYLINWLIYFLSSCRIYYKETKATILYKDGWKQEAPQRLGTNLPRLTLLPAIPPYSLDWMWTNSWKNRWFLLIELNPTSISQNQVGSSSNIRSNELTPIPYWYVTTNTDARSGA